MKTKILFVSICLLMSYVNVFAQESDSIAMLYQRYIELYEQNETATDEMTKLKETITGLNKKLGTVDNIQGNLDKLSNTLNSNLEQVNRLTNNDIFTKKSRLNAQKEKIVNTSVFVGYANNSFDAIDAALAQSDYLSDVSDLNNPTNTELGFSLSEEITNLLEKEIIKGNRKFNGKNVRKFLAVTQNIIKDPFVATVTSTVPGLSAIQGVLGLVSNVIVKEEDVTVDDYKNFKREMDKFILHYDGLARANDNFNANVGNLQMRLEALRTVKDNYTLERIKTVHPEASFVGLELHQVIANYYTPLDLEKNIQNVIQEYQTTSTNLDYTKALSDERLTYPFYAINQAQFIKQELEALTNEYISSYKNYHKAIQIVLEKSKALSKEPATVDKKINELDTKLERLITTFEKNVKIENVINALNDIPTF
jgi:hypothetical protein